MLVADRLAEFRTALKLDAITRRNAQRPGLHPGLRGVAPPGLKTACLTWLSLAALLPLAPQGRYSRARGEAPGSAMWVAVVLTHSSVIPRALPTRFGEGPVLFWIARSVSSSASVHLRAHTARTLVRSAAIAEDGATPVVASARSARHERILPITARQHLGQSTRTSSFGNAHCFQCPSSD
jgi:hypothetical protein